MSPDGRVLGIHKGFACYTVGQRKGLGIALGQPVFVSAVNPTTNSVTLGPESDIFTDRLIARDVCWVSGDIPTTPFQAFAKIRYNAAENPAQITPLPNQRMEVLFAKKQRAITPGQSVVIYDGNCVIGGGVIE